MAWNQPTRNTNLSAPNGQNGRSPKKLAIRGMLAALIIVGGAFIAWWLLPQQKSESENQAVAHGYRFIKTPEPSGVPKRETMAMEPVDTNARPTKIGQVLNGYVMLASGKLHRIRGERTNDHARVKAKYAIFKHPSENQIAALLSVKPGTPVMPLRSFNGKFKEDFIESIKEPIVVSENDSPEQRELKQAVIQAKIELKDAYDRGEDIEQIILASREELRKLGQYKRELQIELQRMQRDKNISGEELELAFDAANKMLESKGIAPVLASPLTRQKMRMMYREQKEQKEK